MNIIFGNHDDMESIDSRYTVLELDTLRFPGSPETQTAWCVISAENLALMDLSTMTQFRDLHNNMMKNYRLKNWKYCEDALEHLRGRWRGELDSFYTEISERVARFKQQDPGPDWDGVYEKHS